MNGYGDMDILGAPNNQQPNQALSNNCPCDRTTTLSQDHVETCPFFNDAWREAEAIIGIEVIL